MIKAFRVKPDKKNYRSFELVGGESYETVIGIRKRNSGDPWITPVVKTMRGMSNLPQGDYPSLADVRVFSERSLELLRDLLEPNGEILPLSCNEGVYHLFLVTNEVDLLDVENSEVTYFKSSGRLKTLKKIVLKSDVPIPAIFRLKDAYAPILVNEEFKNRVDSHNLKGFLFEDL